MIVLSHRGCWKNKEEKNSKIAFERSFNLGFGTETDIRDYHGELVISHDIPKYLCFSLQEFLATYLSSGTDLPLALNIKADGLQVKLKKHLIDYNIRNYFVFDMSIPDSLGYLKNNFNIFTRQSEYEPSPAFYEYSAGVWLDEFNKHWINKKIIGKHIKAGKKICIVSPELHGRDYKKEWSDYKEIETELKYQEMMICTDLPELANNFFNG